jgi:hypothetical protein
MIETQVLTSLTKRSFVDKFIDKSVFNPFTVFSIRNFFLFLGSSHLTSVADPDHFDTDPDHIFYFDTDPDPACDFSTDLDPYYFKGNVPKTALFVHLLDFPCQ